MIKLKEFRPSLVVRAFPEKVKDPADINLGRCMQWAYMAYYMFEGVELWSMRVHAFISYQGKFYDSERLRGVRRWRSLPSCNYIGSTGAAKYSVNNFKRRWDSEYKKYDWKTYRRLAQSFVEKELHHDELVAQGYGG